MSDTLTAIAAFQAKPGQEDRLRDELNAMIEPSETESGCLGYRPLVDTRTPGAMIIVEEWADRAALDLHFETPHFKRAAAVLAEVLAEPFALRLLAPAPEPTIAS